MAARKDSRLKKNHREAIQTTMLLKRLTNYGLSLEEIPLQSQEWLHNYGEQLTEEAEEAFAKMVKKLSVRMEPSQVTAVLGLLKKSLPDLKVHEHTGEDGGPIMLQAFEFPEDGDVST